MHAHAHTHTCSHTHTHMLSHTHTHTLTHTHRCILTHTYMLMHTHTHTYTHMHQCTLTHMHVHTPTFSLSLSHCTCFLASDWRSHSVMLRTSPEQMSVELSCSQCVTNPDPTEIHSAICKLLTATFCTMQWHPFSTQPPSRQKSAFKVHQISLPYSAHVSLYFWFLYRLKCRRKKK